MTTTAAVTELALSVVRGSLRDNELQSFEASPKPPQSGTPSRTSRTSGCI